MEFSTFGLSYILLPLASPLVLESEVYTFTYYASYTSLFTSTISKTQILAFCPGAFVLLHGQRRGGTALLEHVWRILLTDGLQGGSRHPAYRHSSGSCPPTSTQGPAGGRDDGLDLPARGREWVVEA